jgi:hypothetical protein
LKIGGIGCLTILAATIVLVVLVGVVAHNKRAYTTPIAQAPAAQAAGIPQAEAQARAYILSHGGDGYRVQANILNVELAVGEAQRSATQASVGQLAQAAQTAHDNIDAIRTDFTCTDSGTLGDAEGNVLVGANDLKNAMGALVAYTGSPNAATLAQFNNDYENAKSEWNSGVRIIWRTGRRTKPPIL